jgi:hypothetical protein
VDPNLQAQAEDFASDLNNLIKKTFKGKQPQFRAITDSNSGRVSINTHIDIDGKQNVGPISVSLIGRRRIPKVLFDIEFECQWSSEFNFLAVQESSIELRLDGTRNPLFRYDFDKHKSGENPSAYLHVHAHRDEIAWLMIQGNGAKPRERKRKGTMPVLSSIHFPLGGERFRPCVEDILQFCIYEFGLEVKTTSRNALETGRVQWRNKQLKAAISDSPLIAVAALREYGWVVEPGPEAQKSPRETRTRKL